MVTEQELLLYKKIAKLRHCHTTYDKNLDLMYDVDGKPTELRKDINKILYKIASGELGTSFLSGVNFEIKYAKEKAKKEIAKVKKKKKKKADPSKAEQVAKLMKGLERLEKKKVVNYKYLNTIGMRPHQLHKLYRKALPYYKSDI